jgi:hypothetical protein
MLVYSSCCSDWKMIWHINTACHLHASAHHMKYRVVCLGLFLYYRTHCTDEAQLGRSLQWPNNICNSEFETVISYCILMLCKLPKLLTSEWKSQQFHIISHKWRTIYYFQILLHIQSCTYNTCEDYTKAHPKVPGLSLLIKYVFLISNFCRVLNVECFLLDNSPASEFYMPTFRNTLSVPYS